MPNWKKVITSGSDACLNSLHLDNGATINGNLHVTESLKVATTNQCQSNVSILQTCNYGVTIEGNSLSASHYALYVKDCTGQARLLVRNNGCVGLPGNANYFGNTFITGNSCVAAQHIFRVSECSSIPVLDVRGNQRVGIGIAGATPQTTLHVGGTVSGSCLNLSSNADITGNVDIDGTFRTGLSTNFLCQNVQYTRQCSTTATETGFIAGRSGCELQMVMRAGVGQIKTNTNSTRIEISPSGYTTMVLNGTCKHVSIGYGINDLIPSTLSVCGDSSFRVNSAACSLAIGDEVGNASTTGVGNTLIGYRAGCSITTGYNHTLIGPWAGRLVTNGLFSTMIGHQAGYCSSGNQNTFIGDRAGYNNTSNGQNVAIGTLASYTGNVACEVGIGHYAFGQANTTRGNSGIAIGVSAGNMAHCSADSIMIGRNAGYTISGSGVVAIGFESGRNANSGCAVMIGYRAGYCQTGGNSVAIGTCAGYNSNNGNIAIGELASANHSGSNHTIHIGSCAGRYSQGNQTVYVGPYAGECGGDGAIYSVGIGSCALRFNCGSYNTAIGYASAYSNTSACTTAFGAFALFCNTTQQGNTAVGINSLRDAQASFNTALGHRAGRLTTTGGCNTFIGYDAGYDNTTGACNTFIGVCAGYNTTASNASTIIGFFAGRDAQAHFGNTLIGAEAGLSVTAGLNVILGANAGRLATDANGSVHIGYCSNGATGATSGIGNVTIGQNAGFKNQGAYNNYIGRYAGPYASNSTGCYNVANGSCALFCLTSGFWNSGNSAFALYGNTTGHGNVGIGYGAGFCNNGDYNVFLGYLAGRNCTTNSNTLIIGNSLTSELIYGEFETEYVKINADLAVRDNLIVSGSVVSYLHKNEQTAGYTLALSDLGKMVEVSSLSAVEIIIPTNASVAFPTGSQIMVARYGSGDVSFSTSATLRSVAGESIQINSQYGAVTLVKRDTDEWYAFGDISAS